MSSDNFYTSFNARHLAPKEVAETFIWSESFGKLLQNNHSIILGARGCGKTTLMKMLTIPALYNWNSEKADDIRNNIPFYGVYISTDIYWNVKNQTYGSQLEKYGNLSEQVSHFAVNSNVFASLCDTFLNIINTELEDNDEKKEVEICKELIKAWKLSNTIPKLKYVREAIYERVDEVNQLIQEVIFNYNSDKDIPQPDYFNLSFESSLELVIPKFERIYDLKNGKKWALCFDELEFAPEWLRKKLFSSLRSRTQYIIYKLSSSPILPSELKDILHDDYGPTSGNDVQLIKMWTSDDNEDFSRKIIASLLKNRSTDIDSFFGSNPIYNKTSDSYTEGSDFYLLIKELINKDHSFKQFLLSKSIDIENPVPKDKREKDTLFRKIKPIVYFRSALIDTNKPNQLTYRSRKKAPDLYFGIEVLQKICDGNPRWLIGIVSQMLIKCEEGNTISKIDQYNELSRASKRFKNVIANIPVGSCNLTIVDILDRVGGYFKSQLLGEHFQMDPKGTFIVDKSEVEVTDDVIELIEKGVSQGAIILLDSKDDSFDFKVREQRFKLSYLFAILYDLPLRTYPASKLSECLSDNAQQTNQTSLFS